MTIYYIKSTFHTSLTYQYTITRIYIFILIELVSKHINISPKVISAVLNSHQQQSFSHWLNGYRVAAFKQRILTADSGHLTLAGIAFECGFNSQASFQRIFKQYTGMVPSKYRDSGTG